MYRVGDYRLTKRYVYVQSRIYVCTTAPTPEDPLLPCTPLGVNELRQRRQRRQRRQPSKAAGRRKTTDQVKVKKASYQDTEGIVSSVQVTCIIRCVRSVQVTCIVTCCIKYARWLHHWMRIKYAKSVRTLLSIVIVRSVQVTCIVVIVSSTQTDYIVTYVIKYASGMHCWYLVKYASNLHYQSSYQVRKLLTQLPIYVDAISSVLTIYNLCHIFYIVQNDSTLYLQLTRCIPFVYIRYQGNCSVAKN